MNRTLRVIACAALTGCYSYHLAPLAGIQPKDQVRVTARDGRRGELHGVTVVADTLRGFQTWRPDRDSVMVVAVADVSRVEVRRLQPVATGLTIVGVSALVFATVVTLAIISQGGPLGSGSIF